jgi:cell division protein FtsI/penicillin-binding protein 2
MYGLEGYYNDLLSGKYGEIRSEKDTWGNIIAVGENSLKEKEDGANLVLTIDRAIQYKACADLQKTVDHFKAEKGSLIVMDPKTGAILAMCGSPDYNPDQYSQVTDGSAYNIPAINEAYEPGSIFKTITMSAAIDTNKVTPDTTYVDTGGVKFGPYTIKNYKNMVYGKQTMTEVLDFSINTGAMFAMEQTTPKVFLKYVENFGFGQNTGIQLDREVPGDISNLYKKGDVYPATASFGQGIMVTPLQIASAYAAVANGGVLMKPYIVSQIIKADGTVQNTEAQAVRQVISSKTALTVMGMLVSVVENGHGKNAAVAGYTVGGKTGTAQKAGPGGRYTSDVDVSFVGFAPFNNPKVVIAVAIRRPAGAPDAVTVAAPVFGDVAKFIMEYYNIPHDRDIPANFKPLPAWRYLSEPDPGFSQ